MITPKMDLTSESGRIASEIVQRLQKSGFTAFFAGGCVRDFLMSVPPQDFDIATTATPDQVEKLFTKTVPVGKQFGVMLVVEGEHTYEVATFRKDGGYVDGRHPTGVSFTVPEEDAKRRDFTVNGLFYDPSNGKVLDYVGGEGDIQSKMIRAIGDPALRFEEDKLRILRAIRFASTLGFEIEAGTWNTVKQMAGKINVVSPERIRDEIIKMFTRPGAARGFRLLADSGLMKEILPEVEALRGVAQPPEFHPEGDVFDHTAALLERLDHPPLELALAALFHDIGKPATYALRNGKITFYEHAPVGAKMVQSIMRRLRFSNEEIDRVSECVGQHMAFADVQRMRAGKLKRFVSRPTFQVELELHKIDCEASHGMVENYAFLKNKLKEYEAEDLKPEPLLNGHDLQALGMVPGPAMKPLLEELYDLQLEGTLKTKSEALEYAQKKIQSGGGK